MTDMVVLAFDSENGADQGRQKLIELNDEYVLNLVDAVEVVRHADGKVKLKNIRNLTGVGAMGGAFARARAWLVKNREKEIEEAEKRHERKRANELKEMSVEDYLFYYFNDPEIQRRLEKDMKQSKSEEVKRLSFILTKVRLENLRLERLRL